MKEKPLKIKRKKYNSALNDARDAGYEQGLAVITRKANENFELATAWRHRYEQLKADGPDLKTEIEAAYSRGSQHALMQVRGQLMTFLNNVESAQ